MVRYMRSPSAVSVAPRMLAPHAATGIRCDYRGRLGEAASALPPLTDAARDTRRDGASMTASRTPSGAATLVFRVAIAVAAVHAMDDAWLQPNPGTSAADHLTAGLVPLAGAVVAGLAYPRLPGAWRAVISLSCGTFAAAPGLALSPSVPSLAGAVAGLALLALGAWD